MWFNAGYLKADKWLLIEWELINRLLKSGFDERIKFRDIILKGK